MSRISPWLLVPPLFFLLLLGASPTNAQPSSPLVGAWKGEFQGFPVQMTLKADGTGEFTGDLIRWRVQGPSLIITDEEGEATRYGFEIQGSQLTLSGGDLMGPMTFNRAGGPAASPSSSEPGAPPEAPAGGAEAPGGSPGAPREGAPAKGTGRHANAELPSAAPAAAGGRGSGYTHDEWGVTFDVPPAWKVGQREGLLLLGSDTEAGLMIIRFGRGTSLEQLVKDYGEGMSEDGVMLMPAKPAQEFPAGRNRGMAGELAGTGQDGSRLRGRIIAVASPYGDAAVVFGLTTEEKYQGLRSRVETLASSLSFARPKAAPVLEFLAGQYYYISASAYGSSERYLNLCGDGSFYEGNETYSAGSAGVAAGGAGGGGRWTAEGDASQGVIRVTFRSGETREFPYRRSGSDLSVGGRTYARYGDGSCTKRSPVYD